MLSSSLSQMNSEFLTELDLMLFRSKNPNNALKMEAYMKNKFSFLGVKAPIRNSIEKEWFKYLPLKEIDWNHWELVDALWNKPEREYQYIAQELLKKRIKKYSTPSDLINIERLMKNKSWWDTLDFLASTCLGMLVQNHPEIENKMISKFSNSNYLWLERAALIYQLKFKDDTKFDVISRLILQYNSTRKSREIRDKDTTDFFIQKAIGWSLRQYSKYNSEEVENFVEKVPLSNLAKREASKYL